MKTTKNILWLFFLMFSSVNMQAYGNNTHGCDQQLESLHIDQVFVSESGVFLLVNGCWLSSQGMQTTDSGIFLLENGEWIPLREVVQCDNYYVWQCPICKTYNPQGTSRCLNYKNHPK